MARRLRGPRSSGRRRCRRRAPRLVRWWGRRYGRPLKRCVRGPDSRYFAAQTANPNTLSTADENGFATITFHDVPSWVGRLAPMIRMLANPPPAIAFAPAGQVAVSVTACPGLNGRGRTLDVRHLRWIESTGRTGRDLPVPPRWPVPWPRRDPSGLQPPRASASSGRLSDP